MAGSNRVTPNYNVMGVAKAALESATRYLANDLGPQKIRVNAISPGPMKTLAGAAIGGAPGDLPPYRGERALRANATLEAIGGTAVYLCSDYGACTTGEVIRVDGGYHVLGMPQGENASDPREDRPQALVWARNALRRHSRGSPDSGRAGSAGLRACRIGHQYCSVRAATSRTSEIRPLI